MTRHLDALLALWTTSEIAACMGASSTEVSRWRGGHRRPQAPQIRRIGDALAALRVQPRTPTDDEIAVARRDVAHAIAADATERRAR